MDVNKPTADHRLSGERSGLMPTASRRKANGFSNYGQFIAYVCVALLAFRLVLQDAWYTTLAWSPAFPDDWESTIVGRNALIVLTPYMLLQLIIIIPQMFLTPIVRDAKNVIRLNSDRFSLMAWLVIAIINIGSTYYGLHIDLRAADVPSIFVDISFVDMPDPLYVLVCFVAAIFVSIAPERILRQAIARAIEAWNRRSA